MIPRILVDLQAAYIVGGYDAGAQMMTFYPNADRIFPILPNGPEILPDTPAESWGLAWFYGLNSQGRPRFAVRDDITLTSKIAWHESGHALEAILILKTAQQKGMDTRAAEDDIRSRYWHWRGFDFHGTWWDSYQYAASLGASAGWAYLPGESIAESISAAVGGYVESEWTMNWGMGLANNNGVYDPSGGGMRSRVFWLELMNEVEVDEQQIRQIAQDAASEAVARYKVLDDMTVEAVKARLAIDAHHRHDIGGVLKTSEPLST